MLYSTEFPHNSIDITYIYRLKALIISLINTDRNLTHYRLIQIITKGVGNAPPMNTECSLYKNVIRTLKFSM